MSRRNIKVARQLVRLAKELVASKRTARKIVAGSWKAMLDAMWDAAINENKQTLEAEIKAFAGRLRSIRTQKVGAYADYVRGIKEEHDMLLDIAQSLGPNAPDQMKTGDFARMQYTSGVLDHYYEFVMNINNGVDPKTKRTGELEIPYARKNKAHGEGLGLSTPVKVQGYEWDSGKGLWVKPVDSAGIPKRNIPSNPKYNIGHFLLVAEDKMSFFQGYAMNAFEEFCQATGMHWTQMETGSKSRFYRIDNEFLRQIEVKLFIAFNQVSAAKQHSQYHEIMGMIGGKAHDESKEVDRELAEMSLRTMRAFMLNEQNEFIACADFMMKNLSVLQEAAKKAAEKQAQAQALIDNPKTKGLGTRLYPNGVEPQDDMTLITGSVRRNAGFGVRMRRAGIWDWFKGLITPIWNKVRGIWNSIVSKWENFVGKTTDDNLNGFKASVDQFVQEAIKNEKMLADDVDEFDDFLIELSNLLDKTIARNGNESADVDDDLELEEDIM